MMKKTFVNFVYFLLEPIIAVVLLSCALVARFFSKAVDVGLGPLPLINNLYHKKVFELCGYTAETFVYDVWHITSDFDVRGDLHPLTKIPLLGFPLNALRLSIWMFFRYRCLLIYFNGATPFGVGNTLFLWRLEPFLLKLAGIKTIVLGYGADVQVMSRSSNLLFKDALSRDYPVHKTKRKRIAEQIDLWTSHGDHVVGGCEWVDYMHHWDTLMISHFSIDTSEWDHKAKKATKKKSGKALRVLHAPNHREIKGTRFLLDAVEELKAEGVEIELALAEKLPNHEVHELIQSVDVVVDQLIIGWYAMFAIESMALGKPVVCNLRDDLTALYRYAGLYSSDEEIPMIQADPFTIKDVLMDLYERKDELEGVGECSRSYVMKHHSLEAIEKSFSKIAFDLIGKGRGGR